MTKVLKGKPPMIDLIFEVIPMAIVTLGTIGVKHLLPRVDPDIVNLIACIVVIVLLLTIYYIRRGRLFSKVKIMIGQFLPISEPRKWSIPIIGLATIIIIWVIPNDNQCIGRSPGSSEFFSVYPDYEPSGYMGDTGDIVDVSKGLESVRFKYEVKGMGPHHWDLKYINGKLNENPAKFAGILYLSPPNNFGQEAAFDLRADSRAIEWEARSLIGEVDVEFVIGGVNWVWDDEKKIKIKPPCPCSLRRKPLGTRTLTKEWQPFEVDLSNMPKEEFMNVIGGFAWVITWGSNDIQVNETGTGPEQSKTFEIEIRNIRYKK
jgi:hypothetical protein